ncbi:zinc-binding alcohol dehydrogenase family protein [Legionella taurinensis]|uniref:Zinc-type alcohol dehydrogenase-like protein n=1 Tax=Legionella taurinensis TaxID=70611 RepID=A0A3A5L3D2_9GAMM|nr:zinc-binding alcohol dehydrogenase family protein [Legionella taurinensis]RJT46284.1 zinc-binding alcohol dehydrogenase family protein [Legionella taurinensis]RJT66998.1 zinc-binding alcohol dehydrogenase family protein [Legionella taurinensis]STY26523.1 NADPH-quinone reductase and Zn-dependent oxidoreductase [Legionella taurinensis]
MKAVGYQKAGPANVLTDIELPIPTPGDSDLLVEVKAVAVNPVDCKVRVKANPEEGDYRILGWDAAGVVKKVGAKVSLFKPGDEVWYAGDLMRAGCNSEYHLIDENLVGKKPKSLSFTQAAAMPLTSLTAWELLFDRLAIDKDEKASILITGAAGGVGSILVQLARQLTSLTIIGTASRQESIDWILKQGGHFVIDHTHPMLDQLNHFDINQVDYVASLTHSDSHAEELIRCLKPQAKFALIDDPVNLDIKLFKLKSLSVHWEMMFTRSMYKTADRIQQHTILNQISELVDQGNLHTTLNETFGPINAANLKRAHELIESGRSRGKIVLTGF